MIRPRWLGRPVVFGRLSDHPDDRRPWHERLALFVGWRLHW